MLVLMRRVGEDIFLTVNEDGKENNIRLTVSKISGSQVTLGIEANQNVKILRTELIDKKQS